MNDYETITINEIKKIKKQQEETMDKLSERNMLVVNFKDKDSIGAYHIPFKNISHLTTVFSITRGNKMKVFTNYGGRIEFSVKQSEMKLILSRYAAWVTEQEK